MGTGERSADLNSEDMDDTNRRQLSPDQRAFPPATTYMNYDVVNEYASPPSLAVADWPLRPQPDQSEPVFVVPYPRDPVMMGYGPVLVTPTGSMSRLYEDDWSAKKPRRGRRRLPRQVDMEDPPRSCKRECVIYFGGIVILAIALTAIIAIVYTYNSSY